MNKLEYYLVSIERSAISRKKNIDSIKKSILKYTGKKVNTFGMDGNKITRENIINLQRKGFLKKEKNYKYMEKYKKYLTNGEIGCFMSHVKVWLYMVNNKIPYGLVLEDDALLDKATFFKNIKKIFKNPPLFFEFISLYHSQSSIQKKLIENLQPYPKNNILLKISWDLWGTVGYIISLSGAQNFLDKLLPINMPVDKSIMFYFHKYQINHTGYITSKPLVWLYDTKSFIR